MAFAAAYTLAFLLRFEFGFDKYDAFFLGTLPLVLLVKLPVFYVRGTYRILWAYVGFHDLRRIATATVISSAFIAVATLLFTTGQRIPRSIFLLDGLFTFLFICTLYAALRSLREATGRVHDPERPAEPVFIVGAGDAGDGLLRELTRNVGAGVKVVGFLDDDAGKRGRSMRGIPVLGRVDQAKALAEVRGVRRAYIAIPSAAGPMLKSIAKHLLDAGMSIKVLPPLSQLSQGSNFVPQLRDISIEDLLRREPVKLDTTAISAFLKDKVVLVTGGAGSIGSELCRQVLQHHPAKLVVLDAAESPLHDIQLELTSRSRPGQVVAEFADVTIRSRIDEVFAAHKPAVVFHAAALKHVPLMEAHPKEAVRVNVGGTRSVAEAAKASGVGAFVMISTDKAVNPTSVMGATKRVAELLVRQLNGTSSSATASSGILRSATQPRDSATMEREGGSDGPTSGTKFMSVRFGNVLGSNGSVVPIFKKQIAAGGPLTVTHPDMKRYFMTIPEAVQLVLQASVLGKGGEVFVLDMGDPVKIVDLAEDLIRLSGLQPHVDIKIEFTGIRPGEKLFEELLFQTESYAVTAHPQIRSLNGVPADALLAQQLLAQRGISPEIPIALLSSCDLTQDEVSRTAV